MCWLCEHHDRTFTDYLTEVETILADHGWLIQGIDAGPESPAWAYTVGLTRRHRPELVITGLPYPRAADILTEAVGLPATATDPGTRITIAGQLVESVAVAAPVPRLVVAEALFGHAVDAVQLVYPDRSGSWPWNSGYSGDQPLLGLPMH
ncbi:DUF4262 domain-containing protein [Nocardia miyunensis]|uniref:DUF4262 domain-containing protein n=1 Tax=Nocardia miyunensis TaxID=282684 RepID=UPI0008373C68|nr:DUF4262 domain-containing protein [Nocardia miyunensis]